MSTAVKRACDACHRRKVKCDGVNPCRNCSSAQLACTYNAIPQKKGPKGSRAKVISELRETQRQSSLSAKVHGRMNGCISPSITMLSPTPGLLTNGMIRSCVDFFFANMYEAMPILNRQRLEQDAITADITIDTYCLLVSLSAFTMLQPGMSIPGPDPYEPENIPGGTIVTATLLLDEVTRVRKSYDFLQFPTLFTIATSYFIYGCYYGLEMQDKAWLSLREATSLIHLVRMNKEEAYIAWDDVEASCRRQLYWLLFVAERAYALQYDRPLSLKASINLPSADDCTLPLSHQLNAFCRIVSIFRLFDNSFLDLWNRTYAELSPSYVSSLREQHADMLAALASADPQLRDARLNQRWLQAFAWPTNLSNGSGASHGNDMGGYQYSIVDVSRDIVPMAAAFSAQGNPDLLSSGLVETLLSITCNLVDVLPLLPSSSNPFTAGPSEYLEQLSNIIAMLRVREHRFAPLLFTKVHDILPRLANPMLQSQPETASEIDIFDGFGSAGMAKPMSLVMDEYKQEESSSANIVSHGDISSAFTSPPSILSLGLGFAHEFAPTSEMALHRPLITNSLPLARMRTEVGDPHRSLLRLGHVRPQIPSHARQSSQPSRHSQHQHQHQHLKNAQHAQFIQQHLTPREMPQQILKEQQQQPQGQTHQTSIATMNSLGQGPDRNQQIGVTDNVALTSVIDVTGRSVNPSENNAGVLDIQAFGNPMDESVMVTSSQAFGPVGDFPALQGSDFSSLGSLDINNLHPEIDFSTMR